MKTYIVMNILCDWDQENGGLLLVADAEKSIFNAD